MTWKRIREVGIVATIAYLVNLGFVLVLVEIIGNVLK